MARRQKQATDEPVRERRSGARRLIAGLRISQEEETLLAVVRPYMTDLSSEGELAYRLWRRGLEVTLAEVAGLGAALPHGSSEKLVSSLVAQRLLLCLPLLRRTGTLTLLGLENPRLAEQSLLTPPPAIPYDPDAIDGTAVEIISGLGGGDFL